MLKKFSVLCEKFIGVFHLKKLIPAIEKLSFRIDHVSIRGSIECEKTLNYCFHANVSKNNIK